MEATATRRPSLVAEGDGLASSEGGMTAILMNTILMFKEDMQAMARQVGKMEKKIHKTKQLKNDIRELKRHMHQLQNDNSQLRNQLAHLTASHYGPMGSPAVAPTVGSAAEATTSPAPSPAPPLPLSWTVNSSCAEDDGPNRSTEMLWHFPLLRNFNFSSKRFVVDDIQKAVMVVEVKNKAIKFANHQFCTISGFSMAELLGRHILSIMAPQDKLRLLQVSRSGTQMGVSEIVSCCYHLLNKGGNLIKVKSRIQFFFSPDGELFYAVVCIDQMLGVEPLSISIAEAQRREEAEWRKLGFYEIKGSSFDLGQQPPQAAPPLPTHAPISDPHSAPTPDGGWQDLTMPHDDNDLISSILVSSPTQ